ncbi:HIT domain-containing protein [Desulfobulbus rhabdoformis]|uniref:HIT family protein n=1 Tax=Desulfobulbus rhabdoformis TaxID=34032 RepID=UPI0019669331|nr:HIT domain-containing protein [Desulfobulbus rhabdoformis]MBM9613409.1 HIT domain-containing protein [Desulfobulbus rhabdoformis]
MKTLWTPWRMEHVTGQAAKYTGCLFEPPGQAHYSKEHLLLFRDEMRVVLLNRFPYANGHLLVAPRRHLADLTELNTNEQMALMDMLSQSCTILRRHLQPHGLNVGLNLGKVAGAGIADHLHFHVVPRWEDDHNFITVCADIRTIPQHIETTFDLLVPDFQELLA